MTPLQNSASQMTLGSPSGALKTLRFRKEISPPALEEVRSVRIDCSQMSVPADGRLNQRPSWCHGSVEVVSVHWWDNPIFKALKLIFYSGSLTKKSGLAEVWWAARR